MARPTGPSQVRVKPGQILRQKITSSVTTMLAAIERQPPTESSIRTSGNERNSEQNNASSYQDHPTIAEHSEPVQFKRRLVLRQHVPVRTRTLVQLQKSYRLAQTYVNESLTDHVEFEKKEKALCGTGLSLLLDEDYVLLRCALRERFES